MKGFTEKQLELINEYGKMSHGSGHQYLSHDTFQEFMDFYHKDIEE
jgi:hypothetical protein